MRQKMEELLKEYGPIVLIVHFTLFFLTLAGFGLALNLGFHIQGTAGKAGLWAAAYGATELTKLIRLAITVALTPVVGRFWKRLRRREQP